LARRNLKSCLEADFLRKLQAKVLLEILLPTRDALTEKGFLCPPDGATKLDHKVLAGILAEPSDKLAELVEAIYLIANVGADERFDELHGAAQVLGVDTSDLKLTAPDLAARIYLKSPQTLERMERASSYERRRKFESFVTCTPAQPIDVAALPADLTSLEVELRERFGNMKRGRRCTVTRKDGPGEIRFVIQHGDPYTRQPSCNDESSGAVVYRPERTDFVILDLDNNELRISAKGIAVVKMFLEEFCKHLFGDKERFIYTEKYTLTPLKEKGKASLSCHDIEGMESVLLTQLEYRWPGTLDHRDNTRAKDVLGALAHRWRLIKEADFVMAKFSVKLTGEKTKRSVKIAPRNVAEFTRGEEGLIIEEWLRKRGFVLIGVATDADTDAAVAGD